MEEIRIDLERLAKKPQRKTWLYRSLRVLFFVVAVITLLSILVPQLRVWYETTQHRQVVQSWFSEDMHFKPISPTLPSMEDDVTQPVTQPPSVHSGDVEISTNGQEFDRLYWDSQAFNQHIFETGQSELVDVFSYEQPAFRLKDYGIQDEIFGVVSIPKINVMLPLYLGATWEHMANGFAQMGQTSVPIGGPNTNCALACHRGWNGMPYLREVEMLEFGDSIFIHTRWGDLEYRVSSINIVDPRDTHNLMIQPGRDLVTLITCHPYAVSTHRYIVTCERYIAPPGEPVPSRAEIIASVNSMSGDYIAEIIKGVTITTRPDGTESSRSMIFWTSYFPPLLLFCFALVGIGYAVVRLFCMVCSSRKKHRNTDGYVDSKG